MNDDNLWNYGGVRVIGYAIAVNNNTSLNPTNWNVSVTPHSIAFQDGPISGTYTPPSPVDRVLEADAVISGTSSSVENDPNKRGSYHYDPLPGMGGAAGWVGKHRTSHLNGIYPSGGNLGMLDGHVEWRKFDLMLPRMNLNNPSSTPTYWW
jgi:prepilin-type processing-associated H-X9-DG protein